VGRSIPVRQFFLHRFFVKRSKLAKRRISSRYAESVRQFAEPTLRKTPASLLAKLPPRTCPRPSTPPPISGSNRRLIYYTRHQPRFQGHEINSGGARCYNLVEEVLRWHSGRRGVWQDGAPWHLTAGKTKAGDLIDPEIAVSNASLPLLRASAQ